MARPSTSSTRPSRLRERLELQVTNLRRELEAETDPSTEAAILYEVGCLYEHALGDRDEAVEHYDRTIAVDPLFQPAITARLRMAEREADLGAQSLLCEAQVAAASEGALRASALTDLGLRGDQGETLLAEAIDVSPSPAGPALLLEWLAGRTGDSDAVRHAVRTQAEDAEEPDLRGALYLDLALAELEADDLDAAFEALDRACESPTVAWQARWLALRLARSLDFGPRFEQYATALAMQLESAAAADGEVDPLSIPVPRDRLLTTASLIWEEAAIRRWHKVGDPAGAWRFLEAAMRTRADDVSLRLFALHLSRTLGHGEETAKAASWFEVYAPEHPGFLTHGLDVALTGANPELALETAQSIAQRHPDSKYARAALGVAHVLSGDLFGRIETLRQDARRLEGEERALMLWHAAQLAASLGAENDASAALCEELYAQAFEAASTSRPTIAREAMGAALLCERTDSFVAWCDELLGGELDNEERTALGYAKYEALYSGGRLDAAGAFLSDAIDDPQHEEWAPYVARVRAALGGDSDLLVRAHERLAASNEGEIRAGHLCAAAHAHARAGRWDESEEALRSALESAPDDPYIESLLSGVLRDSGRPDALAEHQQSRGVSELDGPSLLMAGTTAERNQNLPAARHAYELAFEATEASPSAALALLDIARRQGDAPAKARAYFALAEANLQGGVAESFSVLLGDTLGTLDRDAEAAHAYEAALDDPMTALAAAVGLLTVPARVTTDAQRARAETVLSEAAAPEPSQAPADSRFAEAYGAWRADLEKSAPSADAWFGLAAIAPTESLRARTQLQGLRLMRLVQGVEAEDDLFLLSQPLEQLEESGPLGEPVFDASVAIDEALGPGDDANLRANALGERLHHLDASGDRVGRASVDAATCRALVDAGRGPEVIARLSREIDTRPEDAEIWETLRRAATQAQDWHLAALCNERLAQWVEGPLRGDLLEEAGLIRLDNLSQSQQAEDLFRAALEADPVREVAFERLHDLLAQREDADALQALVASRLAQDQTSDCESLLYERARLLRGFGERDEALEVLDQLLATSPSHAGALALSAEIHVSREHWQEAVVRLQALAATDIPKAQKRVAHLGAADFLETRLGRAAEALDELRAVERLELIDAPTLVRMGKLEASLGEKARAADAFRNALRHDGAHRDAMAMLVPLLEGAERQRTIERFEHGVWKRIDSDELDAPFLHALWEAAEWRSQPTRAEAVRACASALGIDWEQGASDRPPGTALRLDDLPALPLHQTPVASGLERVIRDAASSLDTSRLRGRRSASASDDVYAQLDALCQRFGVRVGSVTIAEDSPSERRALRARVTRPGQIDWLVPSATGLRGELLFRAGRLAWASPRGAQRLLEGSSFDAAAIVAAILRGAQCEVVEDAPHPVARVEIKLARAPRRAVREAIGADPTSLGDVIDIAQSLHRRADLAGLIACGDIGIALTAVLADGQSPSVDSVRRSPRALDLLRFAMHVDSPLWGGRG